MSDFNAVIAAHSDVVWRTAFRLLGRHDDALDCYQETFLAALRISRNEDIGHWRAMLVRIATRRAIDRLRQRYASVETSGNLDLVSSGRSTVESPDAQAQLEELLEQVRQVLATLPEQQAEAFWLRHLEQLSPNEVAELMGLEPGHVRVLVHRAAASLRTALGPSFDPKPISEESP